MRASSIVIVKIVQQVYASIEMVKESATYKYEYPTLVDDKSECAHQSRISC